MTKNLPSPKLSSGVRSFLILGTDAGLAAASFAVIHTLRFEGLPPERWEGVRLAVVLLLVASRLLANSLFRLNRWSFRFSGLTDGARIVMAGFFGTGLFTLGLDLVPALAQPPRSVLVSELLLTTGLMSMVRFTPRLVWLYRADLLRSRRNGQVRTLIVGAGAPGEALLRDLRRSSEHDLEVLGFVDEDPDSWGDVVGGKTVLGATSDLAALASRLQAELVLIAAPDLPASRLREILTLCADLRLRFKVLPAARYGAEGPAPAELRDLEPVDLLERDEVTLGDSAAPKLGSDERRLVAGAAGSIGTETCAQLLERGCRNLVMLDVDENGLYVNQRRFERLYPECRIVAEPADVRDAGRIRQLFARHRPEDVFHAAARKHVPLMEQSPSEAVKTNVLGTRVLAEAAHEAGVRRFVFMSTDKAVKPTSVMGATKRLGELLVRHMAERSPTRFSVVRFGNVLDSAGSVVPIFREQIAAGGPVTVTHPEARRYFMTISEAVGLVLEAAYGDYGGLCVLEMGQPIRILDLARQMITMAGHVPEEDVKIDFCGLRPGEKLDEELLGDDERVVRRVHGKVSVIESPPPPEDVLAQVSRLAEDAAREDAAALVRRLHEIVAEYASPLADDRELVLADG